MELTDHITITTPEGVELRLQLAGLGSRFLAGAWDLLFQLLLVAVIVLVAGAISNGLNAVVAVIALFLVGFFFAVPFEVLARGRTPGKRIVHLRVVSEDGGPVDFSASVIRNLLRIIDCQTLLWVPAMVSILATEHNQRLGDLAGGTLVIRDENASDGPGSSRRAGRGAPDPAPSIADLGPRPPAPRWDASGVSAPELAAVRHFLERRATLGEPARARLAQQLAAGLRPKTAGAPDGDAESFLEALVDIRSRSR